MHSRSTMFKCRACKSEASQDSLLENKEHCFFSICANCDYVSTFIPDGVEIAVIVQNSENFICELNLPITEPLLQDLNLESPDLDEEFRHAIQPLLERLAESQEVSSSNDYSILWCLNFDGASDFSLGDDESLIANFKLKATFVGCPSSNSDAESHDHQVIVAESYQTLFSDMGDWGYKEIAETLADSVILSWRGAELGPLKVLEIESAD